MAGGGVEDELKRQKFNRVKALLKSKWSLNKIIKKKMLKKSLNSLYKTKYKNKT